MMHSQYEALAPPPCRPPAIQRSRQCWGPRRRAGVRSIADTRLCCQCEHMGEFTSVVKAHVHRQHSGLLQSSRPVALQADRITKLSIPRTLSPRFFRVCIPGSPDASVENVHVQAPAGPVTIAGDNGIALRTHGSSKSNGALRQRP